MRGVPLGSLEYVATTALKRLATAIQQLPFAMWLLRFSLGPHMDFIAGLLSPATLARVAVVWEQSVDNRLATMSVALRLPAASSPPRAAWASRDRRGHGPLGSSRRTCPRPHQSLMLCGPCTGPCLKDPR